MAHHGPDPTPKAVVIGRTKLILKQGDITHETVDALVNAANSSLLGGGGVDGAIHRAAGPSLLEACHALRAQQGTCPPGHAVVTEAGNLPAHMVIHAVGPIWHGGSQGEAELLQSAYHTSLELAAHHGAHSIAFPAISTGAYGYPLEQAAHVALQTAVSYAQVHTTFREIRFILFSNRDLEVYRKVCAQLTHKA